MTEKWIKTKAKVSKCGCGETSIDFTIGSYVCDGCKKKDEIYYDSRKANNKMGADIYRDRDSIRYFNEYHVASSGRTPARMGTL